ncbi:hypothetical protein H9Y05_09975 [Crocinitomicaceae bacterium CZZ-1]|uniref:Uncharacterized protein n=1 Tax=Taishania pollutisoli TaxID=2766479 RepID=A0A8J6P6H3_9FLAO|nr:hypothetical protein [Taishania pollutisoli]MBC9812797.1 hypothetical protein [Taishania pollutisoli]
MKQLPITTAEELKQAIVHFEEHADYVSGYQEKIAEKLLWKAQELKNIDLEFEVRAMLISYYNNRHKDDQMLATFPWLLQRCDEDRERFNYKYILRLYRLIITIGQQYSAIPKTRVIELFDDFERRYREMGVGEKMISHYKFYLYSEMGEIERAEKEYAVWQAASYAVFFPCKKCDEVFLDAYLAAEGRYEELLELLQPVLDGRITCHGNELFGLHQAMLACMMLGRWEEATMYEVRSRKHLDPDVGYLYAFSSHLLYYGITGAFEKGRILFEKQLPHARESVPDLPRLKFFTASQEFFSRLHRSGRTFVHLKLPGFTAVQAGENGYEVDALVSYCRDEMNRLTEALDRRNENDYYRKQTASLVERYATTEK